MASPVPFVSRFRRTPLLDAALTEASVTVEGAGVPLDAVIECSGKLQGTRKAGPKYVHELLQGSELLVEPPLIPPKVLGGF